MAEVFGPSGMMSVGTAQQQAGATFRSSTGSKGKFRRGGSSVGPKTTPTTPAIPDSDFVGPPTESQQEKIQLVEQAEEQEQARKIQQVTRRTDKRDNVPLEEFKQSRRTMSASPILEKRVTEIRDGVPTTQVFFVDPEARFERPATVEESSEFRRKEAEAQSLVVIEKESAKGLQKVPEFFDTKRQELEIAEARGQSSSVITNVAGSVGAGALTSAIGTGKFAFEFATDPVGTGVRSAKGLTTALSEGIPQATQTLINNPGFALGFIGAEVGTAGAIGKVGSLATKGAQSKNLKALRQATPEVSIGFSRTIEGGSEVIVATQKAGGGLKAQTIQKFSVIGKQIEGGQGLTRIIKESGEVLTKKDFTFSGKDLPIESAKRIQKINGLDLVKDLKNTGLETKVARVDVLTGDLEKFTQLSGGVIQNQGKFNKILTGDVSKAGRIKSSGKTNLVDINTGDLFKTDIFGPTIQTKLKPKGVAVVIDIGELEKGLGRSFKSFDDVGGAERLIREGSKGIKPDSFKLSDPQFNQKVQTKTIQLSGAELSGIQSTISIERNILKTIKSPKSSTKLSPVIKSQSAISVSPFSPKLKQVRITDIKTKQLNVPNISTKSLSSSASRLQTRTRSRSRSATATQSINLSKLAVKQKNITALASLTQQKVQQRSKTRSVPLLKFRGGRLAITTPSIKTPLKVPKISLPSVRQKKVKKKKKKGKGLDLSDIGSISRDLTADVVGAKRIKIKEMDIPNIKQSSLGIRRGFIKIK